VQVDEYGMGISLVSEIDGSRLAIASYENVYLWDMSNNSLEMLTTFDDIIKKILRIPIG
jgi:hypothetical protein